MDGVLVAPQWPRGACALSVCHRRDSLVVRCELACVVEGAVIESLLLRPLYHEPSFAQAFSEFKPVTVLAYWRRYGFAWTPRSILAAERFGIGVGGSFTARLTRLFPDLLPSFDDQGRTQGSEKERRQASA
ncbi:hypothetical protein EON82_26325 [bacterium]|nr:MAG: hypothetical protein EON82_26325 [bacterium]